MNPLLFVLLLLIFVVAPLTLLGLCLVGRGDPKAPSPFLANGAQTSPLETEGGGTSEGASNCSPESNHFLPNSRPMEDWERKDSDEFIASHFRGGIEGHSLDAVERPEPLRTISMQDRINNTTL